MWAILQQDKKWGKLTFPKTSGTVAKNKEKNWPIDDRRVPSNDPRNNCETHFVSSSLLVKLRFEPRSHFKSRLSLIVRVNVVLNRTVVVDSD